MAKLYIRGILKPVTITKEQAVNLAIIDDDDKISPTDKFTLNGTRFSKKDIKNIIEDDAEDNSQESANKRKEENSKYYEDVSKEYNMHIVMLCNRSPDSKAEDTRLYELAWSAYTKKPITQEFLQEVRKRQHAFFVAHPHHPYASVNISDLLPREKFGQDSLTEVMPSYITTKIQNIISEAFNTAKHLHKI